MVGTTCNTSGSARPSPRSGWPILPERAAGSALLLPPSKLLSSFLPHYAELFTNARRVPRSGFLEHRQHHFLRQAADLVALPSGGLAQSSVSGSGNACRKKVRNGRS